MIDIISFRRHRYKRIIDKGTMIVLSIHHILHTPISNTYAKCIATEALRRMPKEALDEFSKDMNAAGTDAFIETVLTMRES